MGHTYVAKVANMCTAQDTNKFITISFETMTHTHTHTHTHTLQDGVFQCVWREPDLSTAITCLPSDAETRSGMV